MPDTGNAKDFVLSHFRCMACWVVEFNYKCPLLVSQYSIVFYFVLFRAFFTYLISSNLSCNLCLWYYDQLVHFNNKINALNVYRHRLWEYSKRF